MKRFLGLLAVLVMLSGCAWVELQEVRRQLPPGGWHGDGYAARESSWDRTGANADNVQLLPGETETIADIEGAGVIRHIWITTNAGGPVNRAYVIRMYWDGSEKPAVEVPMGDFFGVGNAMLVNVNSWPITVGSGGRSRNCWWHMPFAKGARITVTNEGPETDNAFYYYVDYLKLDSAPRDKERFYAQYRQAYPADFPENFAILETEGRGRYAGCVMSVESREPQWWGEGDDLIEVDEQEPIRGTGTEDYFCDAWGMREYASLFHGAPVCEGYTSEGLRTSMYRFHIFDPIPFRERIKVSIEHGAGNDRADNLSSVAFWYQEPPASEFPTLPAVWERTSGMDKTDLARQLAWYYAMGETPEARQQLALISKRDLSEENAALVNGLIAYADGVKTPDDEALAEVEKYLDKLGELVEAQAESDRYKPPVVLLPTDDHSPLPSSVVLAKEALERARNDLARRVAVKRGLQLGDEIIVEARDRLGKVTRPPAYEETEDFTSSYAKVVDAHLMGSGARFTYGEADPSWARFTPEFPNSGRYEVLVVFSYGANAGETRYEIKHADGVKVVPLEQRGRIGTPERNNAVWHSLGTYRFEKGQDAEKGSVTLHASPGIKKPNEAFEYRAYADSVRFVFKGE